MERKVQRKFTQLIKDLNEGKIKYEPKKPKPIDWFSYTQAQINEIRDFLTLTKNLVDEAVRRLGPAPARAGPGRPVEKPASDRAKAVLVQQFFQVSNRVAEGLVDLFAGKLGITSQLTYQDIERAYDNRDVLLIIKEVFDLTCEPVRTKETEFSIDGTGLPASIKENYAEDKDRKSFDMFIGIIGVRYQLFTAFDIERGPVGGEGPYLVPLLEETAQKVNRIDRVCGDAGYFSLDNIRAIARFGAVPRIYPREGAVINARGCMAKKRMLLDFVQNVQAWLRDYHSRSISETGNSVLKGRWTRPLLKRLDPRRLAEGCFKITTYNIRRLVYLSYLEGIKLSWLRWAS